MRWGGGGENDRDHLETLGKESGLEQGVEVRRLLLPPGSVVPPPLPEASFPAWAKGLEWKDPCVLSLGPIFLSLAHSLGQTFPAASPAPFPVVPPSVPPTQPRSLPPGRVSHCGRGCQGFQKAEARRCHERSNAQPSTWNAGEAPRRRRRSPDVGFPGCALAPEGPGWIAGCSERGPVSLPLASLYGPRHYVKMLTGSIPTEEYDH